MFSLSSGRPGGRAEVIEEGKDGLGACTCLQGQSTGGTRQGEFLLNGAEKEGGGGDDDDNETLYLVKKHDMSLFQRKFANKTVLSRA